MKLKILIFTISLHLITTISPFFSFLFSSNLLAENSTSENGEVISNSSSKKSAEDKKASLDALRNSWYELLDKSQLRKRQKIRAFRLPEDTGSEGTGLTVLWGTWFTFKDVNDNEWNVNAPFSYTKQERVGNNERTGETHKTRNTARKSEDIFKKDFGLFKEGKGKRILKDDKKSQLMNLMKFKDFPGLKNLPDDKLTYVAEFDDSYLDNPSDYVHYQKLIANPIKNKSKKKVKPAVNDSSEKKDLPFLAGYEKEKLFFNWHPKLRGVQLINTSVETGGFYQLTNDWVAWGVINAKKVDNAKHKVDQAKSVLLRAMFLIQQVTKTVHPASSIEMPVIEDDEGETNNDQQSTGQDTITSETEETDNHKITSEANRLAFLLLDHPNYDDELDGILAAEKGTKSADNNQQPKTNDEDGVHEHKHVKPSDAFAKIFSQKNKETTEEETSSTKEGKDSTGDSKKVLLFWNVKKGPAKKMQASVNWMFRNIHLLQYSDLKEVPKNYVAPILITTGVLTAVSGLSVAGYFFKIKK